MFRTSGTSRVRRLVAVLAVGAGVCATTVSSGSAQALLSNDNQDVAAFGIQDDASGAHAEVQVDPAAPGYGDITVAIPGVGVVWATSHASPSGGSSLVQLRYDGSASEDPDADVDSELGWDYTLSGTVDSIALRLVGHVDTATRTGLLNVWIDGHHYQLSSSAHQPSPSALTDVVSQYVTAMRGHDAGAVYDLSDSQVHETLTRAAFVSQMSADPQFMQVTAVSTSGTATQATTDSGVRFATIPVNMTAGGVVQTGSLTLVWDHGVWRVYGVR
jgi:hypothetical protein